MRRVRFIAPARREFLKEVGYYNGQQPGLGAEFTTEVEAATARALAFPDAPFSVIPDAPFFVIADAQRAGIQGHPNPNYYSAMFKVWWCWIPARRPV